MSTALFQKDNDIIWLKRVKVGTPPAWIPGFNYKLGDLVIPRPPVAPSLVNVMFQCVGFLGHSNTTPPTFSIVIGDPVIDNNIEWRVRDAEVSPEQLADEEYYLIAQTVTAIA